MTARPTPRRRRNARGFSLIEVLFALAVIGLALGAAAEVLRDGIAGQRIASDLDTALALAQGEIDTAGGDGNLKPGATAGQFGRFQWRVVVTPYDDPDAPPATMRLFRIEADIAWRDGARARHFAVSTLRLAQETP